MSRAWRIGRHYGIHIYEGDRPVATCHRAADAAEIVRLHNERPGPDVIGTSEAAFLLGVTRQRVQQMVANKQLSVTNIEPALVFDRAQVARIATDREATA